jgi:predicted Zn-dependent protease
MRSEAELAGVLAHEIGDVLKKHHLRAVQKNAGFALIGDLVSAPDAGRSMQAKEAFVHIGRKLYASGLDQSDEYEADRLGVVIAARAGYDAYGLPAVLQMREAQSAQNADYTLLFKTHPAPGARVTALDKLMKSRFDTLPGLTGRPVEERLKDFGR